jgi:hypothetical protein
LGRLPPGRFLARNWGDYRPTACSADPRPNRTKRAVQSQNHPGCTERNGLSIRKPPGLPVAKERQDSQNHQAAIIPLKMALMTGFTFSSACPVSGKVSDASYGNNWGVSCRSASLPGTRQSAIGTNSMVVEAGRQRVVDVRTRCAGVPPVCMLRRDRQCCA